MKSYDHDGLWVVLPPDLLKKAQDFGKTRQAHAIKRRAKVRWEGTEAELTQQHEDQCIFERGVALALGLKDLWRMDTDHDLPRLELPNGTGLWPRACPKYGRPYMKGLQRDFGILISGRVHMSEPIGCVVEVRCCAPMGVIRESYQLIDIGNRGAPMYQVYWTDHAARPITELIERYKLDTSACLPGAPDTISEMIDFAPLTKYPWMSLIPNRIKCAWCGLLNAPTNRECYHCLHDIRTGKDLHPYESFKSKAK